MLRLAAAAILTAPPAFAHTGAHLHPHDSGGWLAVCGALALVALAGAAALREARLQSRGRK